MRKNTIAMCLAALFTAALMSGCGLIKAGSDQFVGEYKPQLMKDESGRWKIEPALIKGNEVCVMKLSRNVKCDEAMMSLPKEGAAADGIAAGKRTIYLKRGERYRATGKIEKRTQDGNEVLIHFKVSRIGRHAGDTAQSEGKHADLSVRIQNVLIQQTCKHTKTVRPGILLISGEVVLRNDGSASAVIKNLEGILINGQEKEACLVYEKDKQRTDQPPPPVEKMKIRAGGEVLLVFGGSVSSPPLKLRLELSNLGSFSLDGLEDQEDRFAAAMLEEPSTWENAAEINGRQWFGTRFRFKLKNNSSCTWVFDAADAFKPTDIRDQKYVLLKETEGCPEVRLGPKEEKEFQFDFLSMEKGINPVMRFENPINLVLFDQ